MLLGKLTLHNYTSYNDACVDLRTYNKALLVGINNEDLSDSNGSGKTNFLDSIGWCVWGESKARVIDENVKFGTNSCFVSLEFEHDGKECSVTRTRDRVKGLTTLNFYINGVLSNGKTVPDTNKKIAAFLRLDYSTYVNSVYLRQDDIFSFADSGNNKEGRDILEKVLNLEEYDLYHEEAKANAKRVAREVEVIEVSMEANVGIDEKIINVKKLLDTKKSAHIRALENSASKQAEVDVAKTLMVALGLQKEELQKAQFGIRELEIIVESSKNEVNALIRKFNTDTETAKTKAQEFQVTIDALPAIIKSESEHKQAVVSNDAIKKNIEQIETQIVEGKKRNQTAASKYVNVSSEVKTIERKIEENEKELGSKKGRMKNGPDANEVCPECLTEITSATIEHFKEYLEKEISLLKSKIEQDIRDLNAKKLEQKNLADEMSNAGTEVSSLETKKTVLSKALISDSQIAEREKNFKKEVDACNKAKQDLDVLNKSTALEKLKSEITTKKTAYLAKKEELEKKQAETPKSKFDDNKIKQVEVEIRSLDNELDAIKQNVHILVAEIKNYETSLESFDIIKKEIDEGKISLANKKRDLSIFLRLQEAFSSKGIKADIIQNAIAELEKHSNDLLGRLTSGRLSVEFITKKEVKASKGEQVEKVVFEVIVNDGDRPLPFHMYSGGEKFRIAFVLRVALAQLLQRRANSKLEFLIVDEGFSPLDQNGVEKIVEVINELQKEFKTILVITHRTDVKQYFDEVITVMRDSTGSRIL